MRLSLQVLLIVLVLPRWLSDQALAQRVAVVEEGSVRLSLPHAREPVVIGKTGPRRPLLLASRGVVMLA